MESDFLVKADPETEKALRELDAIGVLKENRISNVNTVLVILSPLCMTFDLEAIRQNILTIYFNVLVFFRSADGSPIGPSSPERVDLLIDLSKGQYLRSFFFWRKLRNSARVAIGRNVGRCRAGAFDRIYDENKGTGRLSGEIQGDLFESERWIYKQVFALAGIPVIPVGGAGDDLGKSIAVELRKLNA